MSEESAIDDTISFNSGHLLDKSPPRLVMAQKSDLVIAVLSFKGVTRGGDIPW